MYKFEIHRNPNISTDGLFVDADRYDEDGYSFERAITPIWNDLLFKWTKENDRAFFRKTIDGGITLTDADFDWANGIRLDADERNKYRILIVYEKVDGLWTEQWRGFFSIIVGKWNLSQCFAEFSDFVVWDEYTKFIENIEEERNLIDINPLTVSYDVTEYLHDATFEVLYSDTTIESAPCDFTLPIISSDDYFLDAPPVGNDKFTLYKRYVRVQAFGGNLVWTVYGQYRRDYVVQVSDPGAGWDDLGVWPADSGNETHKWVRNYLGITAPSYTGYTVYIITPSGTLCEVIFNDIVESAAPGLDEFENERARYFPSVLEYAVYGIYSGGLTNSTFFSDDTNPVTNEVNQLKGLFVIQSSDLRETSDPATKALYSFKSVEEWVKLINVYWYVETGGTVNVVRWEHKEFFDQGLSYAGNSVGLDITADIDMSLEAKATSVFSYISTELPRIQELQMYYQSGDDFYGVPILYTGSMANWGDENKLTQSTSDMATDLRGAVLNQDAGKDGFFLIATAYDDGWNVIADVGALTGQTIANAPMSVANLQDKFWRWGAQSAVGVLNNEYTEFDDTENNFGQEAFTVTFKNESCCCGSSNDFNPYKLVKTEHGEGRVVAATLAFKDKKLSLELSYGT